jgi:hypothetical protein
VILVFRGGPERVARSPGHIINALVAEDARYLKLDTEAARVRLLERGEDWALRVTPALKWIASMRPGSDP